MTFLFVGGEEGELTKIGACSVDSTTAYRVAAQSRCALKVSSLATTDGWNADFAATTTFWATARLLMADGFAGGLNCRIVTFSDGVTARLALRPSVVTSSNNFGNTNYWQLVKIAADGTVTTLATSSTALNPAALMKVDMYVNYGVSGQFKLYLDGTKIIDYSGDITTNSATTLSSMTLGATFSYTGFANYWSQVIVATIDTRTLYLATLAPAAAGNANTWTTGTYIEVNETTLDDTSVATSATANQIFETTVTSTTVPDTAAVVAVVVNARSQKGSSGPANASLMVRTASTDYTSSSTALPTGSLQKITGIWETNPNTSAPWTPAELKAVGFNIGIKSLT